MRMRSAPPAAVTALAKISCAVGSATAGVETGVGVGAGALAADLAVGAAPCPKVVEVKTMHAMAAIEVMVWIWRADWLWSMIGVWLFVISYGERVAVRNLAIH